MKTWSCWKEQIQWKEHNCDPGESFRWPPPPPHPKPHTGQILSRSQARQWHEFQLVSHRGGSEWLPAKRHRELHVDSARLESSTLLLVSGLKIEDQALGPRSQNPLWLTFTRPGEKAPCLVRWNLVWLHSIHNPKRNASTWDQMFGPLFQTRLCQED